MDTTKDSVSFVCPNCGRQHDYKDFASLDPKCQLLLAQIDYPIFESKPKPEPIA